jgi:hypothetical protein
LCITISVALCASAGATHMAANTHAIASTPRRCFIFDIFLLSCTLPPKYIAVYANAAERIDGHPSEKGGAKTKVDTHL